MKHFDRPVTPAEVSIDLRALISQLAPDREAVYVEVAPLESAAVDDCFPLVDHTVESRGGQAVVGWSLWELPSLFLEAEFHCVWRNPEGKLLDIAPKKSATSRILFLPDGRRKYEGRQVNNVRRVLSADPVLLQYLETFDAEFSLMNRGDRVAQHGEVHLVDDEASEYHAIQSERAELYLHLLSLFPKVGLYHPCPCGSGRKVKWCHREFTNAT
jgi:hypothetical protein